MNKIEVRSNAVPPSPYPLTNKIFPSIGRGRGGFRGGYRGSRGNRY